jgi:hypothetical protein
MSQSSDKRQSERKHEEERIDHGVDETFPASDPPAVGGATKIGPKDSPKEGAGGASEDGGGSDDTPDQKAKGHAPNPTGESDNGLSGIAG